MLCHGCEGPVAGGEVVTLGCGHTWHMNCLAHLDVRHTEPYCGRSLFLVRPEKCPKCLRHCRNFLEQHRCRHGDACGYQHDVNQQKQPKPMRPYKWVRVARARVSARKAAFAGSSGSESDAVEWKTETPVSAPPGLSLPGDISPVAAPTPAVAAPTAASVAALALPAAPVDILSLSVALKELRFTVEALAQESYLSQLQLSTAREHLVRLLR